MNCELEDKIFTVAPQGFEELTLEVFRFQYSYNGVYQQFVNQLGVRPEKVKSVGDIPFIPVQFFKSHTVVSDNFIPEVVFESSGTTLTGNSRHLIKSLQLYRKSFLKAFNLFYGPVADWCIIGLLPSYLERQHSSLVVMVDELIRQSGKPQSGFYLYETERLGELLRKNEKESRQTLLIGVTFALLDLAETFHSELRHTVVMETGGMKGRRKELVRAEVHDVLKKAWKVTAVHSEYGMTELLSQAYSHGGGLFRCPPWMKIGLREEDDPLTSKYDAPGIKGKAAEGLVNVIDLANLYSCSFIATDDIGKLYPDGSFEIMGRMDSSDVRGCNLMVL